MSPKIEPNLNLSSISLKPVRKLTIFSEEQFWQIAVKTITRWQKPGEKIKYNINYQSKIHFFNGKSHYCNTLNCKIILKLCALCLKRLKTVLLTEYIMLNIGRNKHALVSYCNKKRFVLLQSFEGGGSPLPEV